MVLCMYSWLFEKIAGQLSHYVQNRFLTGDAVMNNRRRAHQRQPRHGQHLAAYNVQEKTIPFLVNDGLFAWARVRGAVNKEHMCELLVGCSSRRVLAERFKNHKR